MGDSPRRTDVLFGNGPIRAVQEWIGLGHPEPFRWLALLGDTWGIVAVLGVAFWLYSRETAYALIGAIALGAVSKLLLSMAFTVPRPTGEEIVVYEQIEISSFPSGHVYQTLIPWGVLYVRERLPLIIPVLVVSVVALSRLYLGVHYLGDLVFAVLFGLFFVWAYARLFPRVEGWLYRRSTWFYASLVGLGAAGVLASILFWVDTARRWEILGLVLGAGLALLVERRAVGYRPPTQRSYRAATLAVGFLGLFLFALVNRNLADVWQAAHFITAFLLALWTLLAVPALAPLALRRTRLGEEQHGRPRPDTRLPDTLTR